MKNCELKSKTPRMIHIVHTTPANKIHYRDISFLHSILCTARNMRNVTTNKQINSKLLQRLYAGLPQKEWKNAMPKVQSRGYVKQSEHPSI